MLGYLASSLLVISTISSIDSSTAGPLDALSWARMDNINLPWLPYENMTRCYGELGCLNITKEWYHLIFRPFNVFPLPRSVINTRFILYTEKNPTDGQLLQAEVKETIMKSHFRSEWETKFIIHGFIDTPLSNWVSEMRDELITRGALNVIVVDWAGGSLPLYTQATANTRLVGLEIAYLINKLSEYKGLEPEDVHLIGHSLGAHTAGYAAERIPGLGRITGLDPAEPYFQGMDPIVRLDPGDATLVDVIHTDGRSVFRLEIPGYGMSHACGHLDFYPNNGKEQPGCALSQEGAATIPLTLIKDGIEEASRVLLACNHIRAIKLFIDSINGKCPYVAHRCPSYQHFLSGNCFKCTSGNCALMGYHASLPITTTRQNISENDIAVGSSIPVAPQPGKYFLATGRDFPFCQRHYRFTIELAKPKSAETWVQGHLTAGLFSERGAIRSIDLTPKGTARFEHGTVYQVVVTNPHDLGDRIRKVELAWTHDMNVLEPTTLCLLWCNNHLYVKSIQVETMQMPSREKRNTEYSNKLCAPKREFADIASRGSYSFYDNCKRQTS
ncbi:pancreatic triacylglycerol lipase-like [Topomyia yanbarensis]|uniref:pancreatic triacylglycerol lipase-like n=1 Tax=Topomyia yanbarensis TaxID=2498891 RepID=UPI00273C106F|nr:pancreatic triacylglycerol lipase-like [Topomyia yanbarensis]XP_058830873.1 pancreatic triacylglycerol lipase-like [Topomyia yanbarensis]XP_058830874.1 pancreatic triacylglycerol lipase-like [Topomyia yanbarensis]XP_058830875.1 pancreatic triacylglycerol lipase-like [Topomyia yanbarensis]XP_058830876.1 pancreatic triacylglycerol lipase-like [Topomyia yanbarensis]